MGGFSVISGDQYGSVMNADNVSFDGTDRGGVMTTNGQLLIGSSVSPRIKVGSIMSPNSTLLIGYSSPNITLDVNSSVVGKTITGDSGGALSPTAGNWNILGSGESSTSGSGSTLSIHAPRVAKFIVDPTSNLGTNQTIQSAINAASSGQTIFIRPGTYTENLTLKAGVDLVSFIADGYTGNVIINGTCTLSTAGTVSISGIQLKTNGATNSVVVSGSVASVLNLINCNLNCSANTGISFTSSSASAKINLYQCTGDLGTTGIAVFSSSSAGTISFFNSYFTNSGGSSTANTISAGSTTYFDCSFKNPTTSSSTAGISSFYSQIDSSAQNVTAWTVNGSGNSTVIGSYFASGTAVGATVTSNAMTISNSTFNTSNAATISGAGTISFFGLSNTGGVLNVTTTTQSAAGTLQGLRNAVAPTAGMIGEQIRSVVLSGAAQSLSSNTAKTITSINLTAGIWSISAIGNFTGTGTATQILTNISTTDNTIVGNEGDQYVEGQVGGTATANQSLSLPAFVVAISTTTTYYLVLRAIFAAGSVTAFGRISAIRIG